MQSLVVSQVAAGVIKDHVPRTRPNGNCCASQASGHVASSFASAAYMHERYGLWHGVFGYTAATFVGFTRVNADKHYVDDVLLSALFGAVTGYWFTNDRAPNEITILPTFNQDSTGVELTFRF
ncbi:phosphatase PAP2 family protein [Thalassotalea ponticola]|uniref:phosphatase PAP2 family protein n=1 Tax=Thalassotalea ponticola TaxID=1523392 RepID=UPI0025B44DBA|nr:phosphatase PAP2 family protein [Thalassotalea ponticola]MDN3651473.1 phosphatase PAP2 family protein [Thalassotalea ponticola]